MSGGTEEVTESTQPPNSENTDANTPTTEANSKGKGEAWSISFSTGTKRKASKKELQALQLNKQGRRGSGSSTPEASDSPSTESPAGETKTTTEEEVNLDSFIDLEIAIPKNLTTTRADMEKRNYFDLPRWFCASRPQYKASCGVSSLTSIWNYLYSVVGQGTLPVVSQEQVMTILGFQPPFETIKWGPFTGNVTLMRWFHALNRHFGVTGKAFYAWKLHGVGRTIGLSSDDAKAQIYGMLRNPKVALIYHCHNHYFVPIGYQEQPRAQIHVYAKDLTPSETESHLIIGEVSRGKNASLRVSKWADVVTDIDSQSPCYFNIRHPEEGVKTRSKGKGGNLHCFIGFRSDVAEDDMSKFEDEESDSGVDDD